jgi:hypothetical protein
MTDLRIAGLGSLVVAALSGVATVAVALQEFTPAEVSTGAFAVFCGAKTLDLVRIGVDALIEDRKSLR